MKIDKISMANSLEIRVPFLDLKLVEWVATIPSDLKLRDSTEKYILRLAMKDLLPHEIIKRRKLGFGTPINLWMKKDFKCASKEILERLEWRSDLIKPNYIKKIIKKRYIKDYQYQA